MRDDLQVYYERELIHLRKMAAEFAGKYPKVASRLVLEENRCEDPHVERLLEGFAFLAARVHLKIDDEFPEISEALLSIVYPHLIRPIPSMSIVQFELDPEQGKLSTGLKVDRDSPLYSREVGGIPCIFRTCYETTLWPLRITAAEWKTPDRLQPAIKALDSAGAVRVQLKCAPDVLLPQLELDRLRVYLYGEEATIHTLYEALCSNLTRIVVRDPSNPRVKPVTLPASNLRPVGFDEDQSVLRYPRRSFVGYRLLQEYFTFPQKFFFLDITGLREAWMSGFKDSAEIILLMTPLAGEERRERLEMNISASTFKLGCTPVINLFPLTAEPIQLNQQKYEYPVVPDVRRPNATEIFSVDEVASVNPETQEIVKYQPFYSFRHSAGEEKPMCFWIATRRLSTRASDEGTDMFLTLVDLAMRPMRPGADSLTVHTTCTNRDLPARLPFGNENGDFEMEGMSSIKRIVALRKPTQPLRPDTGRHVLWRLISHLSLNYLSIVEEGREALQQILKLYNPDNKPESRKVIEGIVGVRSNPHFARVVSEHGITFARGTRVEMELDEDQFAGGAYLFSSVMEHFLALYASLNSFTQLVVSTTQRKEVLREWPPASRTEDIDVNRTAVEDELREDPCRFQFFQAVRLLQRLRPERQPVGRFAPPEQEAVRFEVHNALEFPASQIQSIDWSHPEQPRLSINFMGLTGPLAVLPYCYTEQVIERTRTRDGALAAFLDIFNHRIISLFYQAWEKYHFVTAYERGELDRFTHHLLDLLGIGTQGLQDRQAVEDVSLVYYAGLLSQQPRSAVALEQILSHYFDVPAEVEQFAGAWYRLSPSNQCCFEDGDSFSEQLGFGAVVGDEVWDQKSRVRVRLGPLPIARYREFLPDGRAHQPLRALLRFFSNGEFDFEVQLVLKREDVPPCEIGLEGGTAPQLGWVTWMKPKKAEMDPDDTILTL